MSCTPCTEARHQADRILFALSDGRANPEEYLAVVDAYQTTLNDHPDHKHDRLAQMRATLPTLRRVK